MGAGVMANVPRAADLPEGSQIRVDKPLYLAGVYTRGESVEEKYAGRTDVPAQWWSGPDHAWLRGREVDDYLGDGRATVLRHGHGEEK